MGFKTIIEINHDTFHRKVATNPAPFVELLGLYVNSCAAEIAEQLDLLFDVGVVASRHSGDRYIISQKTDGFPARLPYKEADEEARLERAETIAKLSAMFPNRKFRTKDDLLDALGKIVATHSEVVARMQRQIDDLEGQKAI